MKKVSVIIIIVILILSAVAIGYINKDMDNVAPSVKSEVASPIIGIWRHQDVPSLPYYKSWLITINKDGTYKTQSDKYETDAGIGSLAESFGENGTYTLAENKIMFRRSDTGKSRTEVYEIIRQNGQTKLVFKDSNGNNKSSVGVGGKTYDLMFIKE